MRQYSAETYVEKSEHVPRPEHDLEAVMESDGEFPTEVVEIL